MDSKAPILDRVVSDKDRKEWNPIGAEGFVDWLVGYHHLPEGSREAVVSNLKREHKQVAESAVIEHVKTHPGLVTCNFYSIFGRKH